MELGFKIHFAEKAVHVAQSSLQGVADGAATVYRTEVEGAQVTWRFEPYEGGSLISLNVSGQKPLGISRIDSVVFSVEPPAITDRIVFLGRNSGSNEIRYPHELGVEQENGVNCVGKFEHLAAKGFLVAGVAPFVNLYSSNVYKNKDGSLLFSAKTSFNQTMLEACELSCERVYLRENVTIDDFFTSYRKLIPTSSFPMPKLVGWNTWDYYLDRVKAEDITENLEALKKMPFADQLDYIVIDDGWQKGWGDWRENEKFACGIDAVAREIREAGYIPGIWMAPFGVREGVAVLTEHPEWFFRDEEGKPISRSDIFYLDPTHPDAEKFILDAYRYQYAAGYRVFKMDYASGILGMKKYHDNSTEPYKVLARFVRRVRECTGPDAIILGCSLPLECGPDVAPAMRIAVDIHNHFSHVSWISQSLSWSWLYNNRITRIDPDFLVVRGEETADEPLIWEDGGRNDFVPPPKHLQTGSDRFKSRWRHGPQFNAIEAETWANIVAVSGGNIFLSDRMSVLNERGISIINNAMAAACDDVRPLYQKDDQRMASVWKGDRALLMINWEETPRTLTYSGVDRPITSNKPYTLEGDTLTVSLLPHESFVAIYQ